MVTSAVICPECRRVVALGAALPASCFGAIAAEERVRLGTAALEAHPRVHRDCIEIEVAVDEALQGDEALADVERRYEPQLAAIAKLVRHIETVP